jgi:hypothetical protein
VIGGAGVVAVAVGGVVALAAKSDYDAVGTSCTARGCTQSAFDTRESARTRADFATVTMVVGAAAAAGGALLFFWPSSTSSPSTQARANVAVSGTGVRVTVPF